MKPTGLLLVIALSLTPPIWTLRIRTDPESLGGITASPTLIYRRRLNSDRYQQSLYPQTSPRNHVDTKTDSDSNSYINQPNSFDETTNEPKPSYPISSIPPKIKLKSLRRNRSRIRTAVPQESIEVEQQYTTKPTKPKGNRRRKVKRPIKVKPIPLKPIEEELVAEKSNGTGGDKNLALEIGSEDGKYALIDKFFEEKPSQAPGLISYAPSDDFNTDNQYTLGNVKENDIWLSEGHLLVLKGGDLDASLREHWKPIDNYHRGKRPPLRIALDSNNPPPFPVFVNETGPPVFLGPPPPFGPYPYPPPGAFNESFDPSRLPPPGMIPLYPNGTIPNFFGPPPPGFFGGGNNSLAFHPPPGGQYGGGYGLGGGGQNGSFPFPFPPPPPGRFGNNTFPPPQFFPFPPPGNRNGSFPPIFLPPPPGFNGSGGPPPGFPLLPPLVLNPNDNETDDPSIFLPPPYDFDYQDENTTIVPPGPFAPGLVVPPPKDFYTVYNKTTRKPTFPPATGLSFSFGKRPQRPNGKKPKFPITNPPDDSEEAYQPLTTPYPYHSEVPFKKRIKQRPGKANKDLFTGNKYEADTEVRKVAIADQGLPLSQEIIPQPPIVPLQVIHNSISTTSGTTPKPLNNYVYVRGQLKSLAELNQPVQEEYEYEATPRPPFDERGYPTRIIDENEPLILQYNKRPTEAPAKSFYYNTPKYDAIYNNNAYPKKLKKQQQHQHLQYYTSSPNVNSENSREQLPIVQQGPQSIYLDNRLGNQGHNSFSPGTNFQEKLAPVDPTYFTRPNNGLPQHHQKQIIQLQSPKQYSNSNQRQPHLYNHNHANIPQNINYQTTSAFRPAFGPNLHTQQQSDRSKVHFPGQVTQSGPIFDFRTPLYQQGRRPQDGYYSPVTQYYQPLQPIQQQFQQDNYYQSPQGRYFDSQNPNRQQDQVYQQKPQLQPYFNQQIQAPQGNSQGLQNAYKSNIQPFLPQSQTPLNQDVYVNFREPLPQYNTESEAVTTRTVFKAGPSPTPATESVDGKSKTAVATDGSYYSFQRGGPGGFSYKIRL